MAADSSGSDEGVAMSFFFYIQGSGYGVALPEMPQQGHSWPESQEKTPEKCLYDPRLGKILTYSGASE